MPARTPEAKVDALALACARGLSVRAAARSIGENENSAGKWAQRPDFKARVERFRAEVIGETVGALCGLARKAVDTLDGLMAEGVDAELRYKAARAVLADLISVSQHLSYAGKVEELKAILEQHLRS